MLQVESAQTKPGLVGWIMDLFDLKIQLKKELGAKMSREIQMLDIRVNRVCTECALGTDKSKF